MTGITITRALSKINTSTKRLHQYSETMIYTVPNASTDEKAVAAAQVKSIAALASFRDGVTQIAKMKLAIAKSNIESEVTIGDLTCTVTEALALKGILNGLVGEHLVSTLRTQNNKAIKSMEDTKRHINTTYDESRKVISNNTELEASEIESRLVQTMINLKETYGVTLIAPTHSSTLVGSDIIELIRKEINHFYDEIDYVLSEHNATTTIEV